MENHFLDSELSMIEQDVTIEVLFVVMFVNVKVQPCYRLDNAAQELRGMRAMFSSIKIVLSCTFWLIKGFPT